MNVHEFEIWGNWQGGRAGKGEVHSRHTGMVVSLPGELGGSARGINPEEMLAATAASCLLITLGIILEKKGIPVDRLEIRSVCRMDAEKIQITELVHKPKITLLDSATAAHRAAIADAVHGAEKLCPISNALRGNVQVSVDLNSVGGYLC